MRRGTPLRDPLLTVVMPVYNERATIDEIVVMIHAMGAEASRSAVGRYVKNTAAMLARYKKFQEVAKVWIGKINDEPDSDIGRLAAEVLRMVAVQVGQQLGEQEADQVKPMDVMLLSKALDHLSRAGKTDVDRLIKIREKLGARLRELEGKAERGGRVTLEDLKQVREMAYGVVG